MANITLVIAPASGGANFLLTDISLDSSIASLRALVATKLSSTSDSIKLVFEGSELVDGGALREWYLTNLSTVRAVVVGAPAAVASGAPGAAAGTGADAPSDAASNLVSDAEMPRSIVVRGVPPDEPAATEKALFDTFSRFGEIARIVFQDSAVAGAGAASGSQQQAVIIFHRDASAAASLAANGSAVLGSPVHVALASSLAAPPRAGGASASGERLLVPSEAVVSLLARGFLYGHEGVAHVRRYDEHSGLSQRVKVWLDSQDSRFHVRATVAGAYTTALTQVQQLERTWQSIDARFRVQERLDAAANAAISSYEAAVARAMRDPTFNRLATASHDFATEAYDAIQATLSQAKERARVTIQQQQMQQQAAAGQQPAAAAVVPTSDPAPSAAIPAQAAASAGAADVTPPSVASLALDPAPPSSADAAVDTATVTAAAPATI